MQISSLSKEYVRVSVYATESGSVVNPTSDTVQMAFMTSGNPASGDWKTASWETNTATTPSTYFARCLVGPGGTVVLSAGTYTVWVKVTDSPEVPARSVGLLEVV